MVYRSQQATKFVIGCGLVLAATVAGGLIGNPAALAAGVPPAFTQGFSEIVKKVTPAVVNIAVTGGGGEGGRRRGGLPPGPFGGPPGGDEPGGGTSCLFRGLVAALLPEELPVSDGQIPLRPDLGALPLAVIQMRPYHIHHREPAALTSLYGTYEAQEFFVVPLVVKDRVTGVIVVDNQASSRPLEAEPLHALQMLSTQAALVLENAHLYSTIEANNRELMLIRERMLESDRLAALSSLASGMAHEIRNPLVSIGGFARRIAKLVEKDSPLRVCGSHPGRGLPAGKTPARNLGFHRGKSQLFWRSRPRSPHR